MVVADCILLQVAAADLAGNLEGRSHLPGGKETRLGDLLEHHHAEKSRREDDLDLEAYAVDIRIVAVAVDSLHGLADLQKEEVVVVGESYSWT